MKTEIEALRRDHEALRDAVVRSGALRPLEGLFSVDVDHDSGPHGWGVVLDLRCNGDDDGYLAALPGGAGDPTWYAAAGLYDGGVGYHTIIRLGVEPEWAALPASLEVRAAAVNSAAQILLHHLEHEEVAMKYVDVDGTPVPKPGIRLNYYTVGKHRNEATLYAVPSKIGAALISKSGYYGWADRSTVTRRIDAPRSGVAVLLMDESAARAALRGE